LMEAGLQLAYGLVIGLVLGYLVVRVDAFLSGTRGARARRAEAATAHRPEPRRTAALL
jgi:NhaP-type Na+/H+ or K+/H+ antiporter